MFGIITTGARMPSSGGGGGGTPNPVTQFQLVAQGGSTNNAGSVTTAKPQMMLVWAAPAGGLPSGGHYQIIRRTNYGADVDYATTTNNYYVDTAATGFFNAPNIGQGSGSAIGPTTVYDYDVVTVTSGGTRSAKPSQFTCFHYRGGITGTATGGSSTTLADSGKSWTTNQWLGYYVFYGASGNFPTSGSTPVAVCIGNTATTLSLVDLDGNTLSTVPASGNTYQIGGDLFTGVGDVSFGQATGSPAFTDTGGSPVSPHTFCLRMTHDATTGNMGLQRPSADPAGFIYGLEVGAFNYSTWQQRAPVSGSFTEFAIHHRCPTGDLPGPPVSNISGTAMVSNNYGPAQVANTWQGFTVPLSALQFTSPAGGQTTFTGSISGGILTVTSFLGPGFDSGLFITGTGVDAGTYISNNSGGQSGNGTYTVLKNSGAATSNAATFTDGKAFGTNFYKGQYKMVGSGFANAIMYYDDIAVVRVNTLAAGA